MENTVNDKLVELKYIPVTKTKIIIISAITVLVLSLAIAVSWNVGHNTANLINTNGHEMVYITPTGKRYHRENCKTIKNKTLTTLEDALDSGYTACSKCDP